MESFGEFGLLANGTDLTGKNVNHKGIYDLLSGHTDTVSALTFYSEEDQSLFVFGGSADKTIKCWNVSSDSSKPSEFVGDIGEHASSITSLVASTSSNTLVSTAADSTIKIWKITTKNDSGPQISAELKQEIKLKIIPLAVAIYDLHKDAQIIAVAGSNSSIHTFATISNSSFAHCATLAGHSGWIRSLSFIKETDDTSSDLLLASASQDRFIRIWRVHQGTEIPSAKRIEDPALGILGKMVSTKAHKFTSNDEPYSITFEALLLGHEDWVYSCLWRRTDDRLQLLSSSADNSVAIWEADETSGIWVCTSRLGDVSAQKGSTTATGSVGGFWNGLWSADGTTIASLGRTGSWRLWKLAPSGQWIPQFGCSGHVRSVNGISWSRDGGYLLSTSSDQTTRLHAQWKESSSSWHEFARPQIHGYDLNCIEVISNGQFVSGAEEKPLRVFQQPVAVADVLQRLSGITMQNSDALPDAANIPMLGLSNKAVSASDEVQNSTNGETTGDTKSSRWSLDIEHPPLEDQLSKHLLWPEIQKLYGHGYEISAVSVSNDESMIATACKASSIDHAVIRIYDTKQWREFPTPLVAHSLTITDMEWSPDDKYLLSVGRDRIWSIFGRDGENFNIITSKGHTRMILGCSWAPLDAGRIFATAGRDKCVKIWRLENDNFESKTILSVSNPVTTVAFAPWVIGDELVLAAGLENGEILVYRLSKADLSEKKLSLLDKHLCPTKAITALKWRPNEETGTSRQELAVSSEDNSLRILQLDLSK